MRFKCLFSTYACSANVTVHWMQHFSQRLLRRAGLLDLTCGISKSVHAVGTQGSQVLVNSAANHDTQHTQTSCISTNCICAPAGHIERSSHRCVGPSVPHKVHSVTLATKAEEYDLIVAEAGLVRIEGYNATGFIVNDVQVHGAVFCAGDLFTMWNVKGWQDLGPDSLSMLQLFKPAPDLVILGCGVRSQMVPPSLQTYFQQHNIAYEAIDTANAVSTFNILNQEGRKVAGVLLPAGSS